VTSGLYSRIIYFEGPWAIYNTSMAMTDNNTDINNSILDSIGVATLAHLLSNAAMRRRNGRTRTQVSYSSF
jgi:hypothetical protein